MMEMKLKTAKIIFLDEIDALIKDRKDSKNETGTSILQALLVEMDGKRNNCYVLANTNVPTIIGESIIVYCGIRLHSATSVSFEVSK